MSKILIVLNILVIHRGQHKYLIIFMQRIKIEDLELLKESMHITIIHGEVISKNGNL